MSVADKSKGPYKQFFACECGSRFNNEDELKIHFCLSHNGEKEVKVRVQRVYKKLQSPQQAKNEVKTPTILPGPSKTSPIKIEKVTPNKSQMKIVSVQEEISNAQIVRRVTPKKEEKADYKKVYEELNQYAKQNASGTAIQSYRTIQYPKSQEAVTLYKSEPLEPNVVQSHANVVQKKSSIKPIVIPISQMKPNSYIIQQPVKKQPSDTNIQVFKCGDNKFLVRNNPPNKNTVSLQQSDGKPVYVINGQQSDECYQNVIVQENPNVQILQMETYHELQTQFVGIKEEQDSYQEYVVAEGQIQEYVENEEQEVEYEEEYPGEYVTEEYITGDTESANDGEEVEEEEEGEEGEADYENLLEAHEVEAAVDESDTEEKPPKKKYKHKPAKDGEIFPCTVCDRAFTKPMSLTQHLIQVHRPTVGKTQRHFTNTKNLRGRPRGKVEKVEVNCDMCDRQFFGKHALAVHRVKAHLGTDHIKRPFQCELCEKAYRNSTLLNYHTRTHTGEKPYKCQYCSKGFTMPQGLQIHLMGHTDERPFECLTCGKRFKSTFALFRHERGWHERIHTGERPDICRKCGKAFKCQTALLRHDKVHTGDKPYSCPHCQKCFSQSNSMKLHVITVHMKLPSPYKSHHNRYRKRREKLLQKEKEAALKKEETNEEEMNEEETNEEEMEVYFGSEDDAAGYEEVYE